MKRLFQIALIAILVLILFQAAAGGSAVAADQAALRTASTISSVANATPEDVQMVACLVRIKGAPCAIPNVGWNS